MGSVSVCIGMGSGSAEEVAPAYRGVLGLSGPLRLASSPGSAEIGMATPWGRYL
jgi:hypothetical protein